MRQRRGFKKSVSFEDRLMAFANEALKKAETLPPCTERDVLLRKAQKAHTAKEIDNWAKAPGQPPPPALANRG